MKLSVLIPSIPERAETRLRLISELERQCESTNDVEILCFIDNKKRSIGAKRDALKSIAKGEYIAFVDDDDYINEIYIDRLLEATETKADVITFMQSCMISHKPVIVTFGINNPNEEIVYSDKMGMRPVKRKPFPCCAFKRELVKDIEYPDVGYGEDWHWSKQAIERCETEHHIKEILHFYTYDKDISKAPTESNEVWKNPNQ